uniref:Uncharacterized protein n=1 Tax=Glossina palpalis gambiensis TaxID=67801 RepID=A0A1B0BNV8_9MUSC
MLLVASNIDRGRNVCGAIHMKVHQFAFLSFKHILEILIQEIKKSAENSWFSQFKSGKACCQSNKKNVFRVCIRFGLKLLIDLVVIHDY